MDDIFVARLMTTDLKTVSPSTPVETAARELLEHDISSLLVTDDGQLVGILTNTDFVKVVAKSRPKADTEVSQYMTTDVVTASSQQPIHEAADVMLEHGIHHLPVVDDEGALIGILSTTDLSAYVSQMQSATP